MKKKKVFGLDFDDVLMDFYPSLCLFHNENYGTSLSKEDVHSYYIQDIFGCTTEEAMERVWNFYHSTKHHDAKPVSGAMEALQVLEEEYDLHIITARPERIGRSFSLGKKALGFCEIFSARESIIKQHRSMFFKNKKHSQGASAFGEKKKSIWKNNCRETHPGTTKCHRGNRATPQQTRF
jgi:uncharacterized HAD superfamily protein